MGLQQAVQQVFAPGGRLAQSLGGFQPRIGQMRMAQEVATVMEQGGVLVAEAGTGIGKTFAYLIPALLSGERVLVSTATKALQDQLFTRDLPQLRELLGVPVRLALLKGRSSYVCLQRLEQAVQDAGSGSLQADFQILRQMQQWATASPSGDMAEFGAVEDNNPLYPQVTSTRENCLGGRCPHIQQCHVNLARREAMAADVVVINHHLFFADLQIRESGVAELLPSVRSVIFDEAHQLNEIGVQFLGVQLSGNQLQQLARALEKSAAPLVWGHTDWRALLQLLRSTVEAVSRQVVGQPARTVWSGAAPAGVEAAQWSQSLLAVQAVLADWERLLGALAESAPDVQVLQGRASALAALVAEFAQSTPTGQVRWLDTGTTHSSWRLVQSPLDIAQAMRERVLPAQASHKSWIFTSATLGHDAGLTWFVQSCGLEGATVLREPSPFDHAENAGVYVPQAFAQPQDSGHSAQVAALVADAATVLGGRTLVLTTTLRAMQHIGQALQLHFAESPIEVLLQGQHSKRELLARFAACAAQPGRGAVLVGAASFWEGIDIPGEALQLVVIDKLPFAPPGDPLVEARVQNLTARGGNGFKDYFLPQTVVALKQGAGRLLRSESDRGVLVICDPRLLQKSYGRGLLAALPPMRRLRSDGEFHAALVALTRPATTGLPSA